MAASVLAALSAMFGGRLTGYVPRKEGGKDVEAGDLRWDPARDGLVGNFVVVVEERVRRARRARWSGAHRLRTAVDSTGGVKGELTVMND